MLDLWNTMPTWKANIQHFSFQCCHPPTDTDGIPSFTRLLRHIYCQLNRLDELPSLRCLSIYLSYKDQRLRRVWSGAEGFGLSSELSQQRNEEVLGRKELSKCAGIPISVENLTFANCPSQPPEDFVEWCEHLVGRTDEFQKTLQEWASEKCGRPINVMIIFKQRPRWGIVQGWWNSGHLGELLFS
ncbi:hypothetical protein F4808DRAFT_421052 [Astrocystis sublimbata]|nr:hypothetical protein F4808DRAFT_421052 [Astrocystis sublimbata]